MPQNDNKKVKFASVRYGKVCLIIIYICVSVIALTALIMLFNDLSIGLALCAVVLFVFVPIIVLMHFHNAANTVTFDDDKIQSRRRTLTWDTAYLTVHCHSMLSSKVVFIWVYFDDHYLTQQEVRSWRVSRQGLLLRLDDKNKIEFVLSHCKNKIEMCGGRRCWDSGNLEVLSKINAHNARVSD